MPKPTAPDFLAASSRQPDNVPPGWKTMRQWASECGLSRESTQARMTRLLESGQAEMRKFRVRVRSYTMPIPHYRLTGGDK